MDEKKVVYQILTDFETRISSISFSFESVIKDIDCLKEDFEIMNDSGPYFGQASDSWIDYCASLKEKTLELKGYLTYCKEFIALCREATKLEEQAEKNEFQNVTHLEVNTDER